MDNLTHKIEITITGHYPDGDKQHAMVAVSGDGSFEHMIQAFQCALAAAGFSAEVVSRLDNIDI